MSKGSENHDDIGMALSGGGRGKGECGVKGKKGKELWPKNDLKQHNCELKTFNVEECLNISPMLI